MCGYNPAFWNPPGSRRANVPIEAVINIRKNALALACNLSVGDEVIANLQKALDQLNESGEADGSVRQNLKIFRILFLPHRRGISPPYFLVPTCSRWRGLVGSFRHTVESRAYLVKDRSRCA